MGDDFNFDYIFHYFFLPNVLPISCFENMNFLSLKCFDEKNAFATHLLPQHPYYCLVTWQKIILHY